MRRARAHLGPRVRRWRGYTHAADGRRRWRARPRRRAHGDSVARDGSGEMSATIGSRQFGTDPGEYFNRFQDRLQREEQFSEDIRKVISGPSRAPTGRGDGSGYRAGAPRAAGCAQRNLSPGLRAGAALMFGGSAGSSPGTSSSNAVAEATRDSHAMRLQAVERSRRFECPFDDHQSFGVAKTDLGDRKPRLSAPPIPASPSEARVAYQTMQSRGKFNRDIGQKVGAGAPFDAPEQSGPALSSSAAAAASGIACPGGGDGGGSSHPASPSLSRNFAEAASEAQLNKSRMRGQQDLLAGNYLTGDVMIKARRPGSLPPRPEAAAQSQTLLPQAQMKVAFDGGSVAALSKEKVAYLNSKVLAEANRQRNESRNMHGLL